MPIPHPCRRLGGGGRLDQRGHVRDWAPPGWFWEVLPSGGRRLVRSQPVVDLILVWWRSRGPVMVPRLTDTAAVVRHRVSEEDEHVHRYMVALEGRFSNTWQVLQYLAGSSGISLERSCDGSFSLGVHRPRRYPSGATVLAVLVMLYV